MPMRSQGSSAAGCDWPVVGDCDCDRDCDGDDEDVVGAVDVDDRGDGVLTAASAVGVGCGCCSSMIFGTFDDAAPVTVEDISSADVVGFDLTEALRM